MAKKKPKPKRRAKVDDLDLSREAVHVMRERAKEGLGFNCTFVDDDMNVLVCLAQRAVLAGLVTDCKSDMQRRFREASEKCRAGHERALGFPIKMQVNE